MKRILLASLFALVLVGFGCAGGGARDDRWRISFQLPENWVMYGSGDRGYVSQPGAEITKETSEIVLQNTKDALYPIYGGPVKEGVTEFGGMPIRTTGYTAIRVLRLDSRRVISKDAEEVAKNLYRVKECEEGEPCTERDAYQYVYFYEKGDEKYKFIIYSDEGKEQDAIDVILSAKAVSID